jgi:hypothetical protein
MNPLPFFDSTPGHVGAALLILWGIVVVWTSLTGGSDPTRALARRHVQIGIGGAVVAQAPWMLWLAVGIGFVEILESSTLIAVWKLRPPAHPRA